MNQIQLTATTFDHLGVLLRPASDPAPPELPQGSRTAAALHRAGLTWTDMHRQADGALREHVREVRDLLFRARGVDDRLATGLDI